MIYFARNLKTGNIKIGMTDNLTQRLQQLKGQYGDLELLATMPGGRALEVALDMAFASYLVEGMGREWFHDNEALRRYIRNYAKVPRTERRQITGLPNPPTYDRVVNCHLHDLVMQRRKQLAFHDLRLEDISAVTDIPLSELRRLYQNRTQKFRGEALDKLLEYFGCRVNDLLQLSPERHLTRVNHS